MRYRAEVVAYESYGEISIGVFEVEADNEDEADGKACRKAKRLHPNLEDFEVMKMEALACSENGCERWRERKDDDEIGEYGLI